ncbi:esterase-like activity of phytase family protein [Nonomuraea sp. NPDC050328]|uniref:esterase-like activity of phytase family protein n=1 Tax=Nonomuraea sp. NPDC050328 TaxID=3364361 RepID=UPI00378F317E
MSRLLASAAALAAGAALAATVLTPAAATAAPPVKAPKVVSDVELPAPALADFQPVADDRGVKLGGLGSGLFPANRKGDFWMVTDRGPNGELGDKRTFPVPDFAPAIVRVEVRKGKAEITRALTLKKSDGTPITGLSNQEGQEKPYSWDGSEVLPFDPNGLDAEDIVRDRDGTFWLVDEYAPSLVKVGGDGRILARYVPQGLGLKGAGYPVHETLPAILAKRQDNRGFEGLAIRGGKLFLAVQSPLANPDKKAGKASRIGRLLVVDLKTGKPTAEYAYRFEEGKAFGAEQKDLKISGLVALSDTRLLVEERTDEVARLYTVDLRKATDLLGGQYDKTLESGASGAVPVSKELAVDLEAIPGVPDKIEGIALLDPRTLVIANDNDFGVGEFGEDGRLKDSGVKGRILTIRLPKPLH